MRSIRTPVTRRSSASAISMRSWNGSRAYLIKAKLVHVLEAH